MALLRWEWTLANRGLVCAVIDTSANTETVSQKGATLSTSARGTKPDGHAVLVTSEREPGASERPPIEAVVSFDASSPICILRVDGHEIAPVTWPVRERPPPPVPERTYGSHVLIGLVVVALLVAAVVLLSWRSARAPAPARTSGKLLGTFRSMNGLFIAHYEEDLEAKLPVLPPGASGVHLEDKQKTTSIVIAAVAIDAAVPSDAWALQKRLHDEAMANVPKGAAKYEESGRREETCLGNPGAVITGQFMQGSTRVGRLWSCAFVHDGAGYLTMYMLAEPAGTADERRIRAVIDATELTKLADLGLPPEPPPHMP